jgi:hypothetical protein
VDTWDDGKRLALAGPADPDIRDWDGPAITGTVLRKPVERMTATLACQATACSSGDAQGIPYVVDLLNKANQHAEQAGHQVRVEVTVNPPPEACA